MIPGGQETSPGAGETVPALGKLSERDRRPAASQRRDPPPRPLEAKVSAYAAPGEGETRPPQDEKTLRLAPMGSRIR